MNERETDGMKGRRAALIVLIALISIAHSNAECMGGDQTPSTRDIGFRQAELICGPRALYPETARIAQIHGYVTFSAVIGKDGSVASLQLSAGHFLLVRSAMDAAKRYRYKPVTMLGEPIEFVQEIRVEVGPTEQAKTKIPDCSALTRKGTRP